MHEQKGMSNKEIETIERNQQKSYSWEITVTELKNLIENFNNGFIQAEEKNQAEDRMFEIIQSEKQREKRVEKSEESLQDLRDTMKRNNVRSTGVPEREEKKKEAQSLFKEIIAENI